MIFTRASCLVATLILMPSLALSRPYVQLDDILPKAYNPYTHNAVVFGDTIQVDYDGVADFLQSEANLTIRGFQYNLYYEPRPAGSSFNLERSLWGSLIEGSSNTLTMPRGVEVAEIEITNNGQLVYDKDEQYVIIGPVSKSIPVSIVAKLATKEYRMDGYSSGLTPLEAFILSVEKKSNEILTNIKEEYSPAGFNHCAAWIFPRVRGNGLVEDTRFEVIQAEEIALLPPGVTLVEKIETCGSEKKREGTILGCAALGGTRIAIDVEIPSLWFSSSVLHEIGHTHGIDHPVNNQHQNIMNGSDRNPKTDSFGAYDCTVLEGIKIYE